MRTKATHNRKGAVGSLLEPFAAVASVGVAAVGALWRQAPSTYPFGPSDLGASMSLLGGTGASTAGTIAIVIGLLGLLTVGMARLGGTSRAVRHAVIAGAALQVLVLGYVVPDIRVLVELGYLTALVGPLTVLVVLLAGAVRNRSSRWVAVAVVAGIVGIASYTGIFAPDTFADLGRGLAEGFTKQGTGPLYLLGSLASGALWLAVAVRRYRQGRVDETERSGAAELLVRWRRPITIAAALCPMPYALLRMTWLTPWPIGFDAATLEAQPEMRLFGLLLGFAALGGSVLTIGLISRWGVVFPAWLPVLRGRPVPVMAAVVPGLAVAAAITVAGHSVVQQAFTEGWDVEGFTMVGLLLFPFPVWGPLLGAATLAYWQRRRDAVAQLGD